MKSACGIGRFGARYVTMPQRLTMQPADLRRGERKFSGLIFSEDVLCEWGKNMMLRYKTEFLLT